MAHVAHVARNSISKTQGTPSCKKTDVFLQSESEKIKIGRRKCHSRVRLPNPLVFLLKDCQLVCWHLCTKSLQSYLYKSFSGKREEQTTLLTGFPPLYSLQVSFQHLTKTQKKSLIGVVDYMGGVEVLRRVRIFRREPFAGVLGIFNLRLERTNLMQAGSGRWWCLTTLLHVRRSATLGTICL